MRLLDESSIPLRCLIHSGTRSVHLQMELGKWYHILDLWKVSLVFALLKVCSLSHVNFLILLKYFTWGIQQIAVVLQWNQADAYHVINSLEWTEFIPFKTLRFIILYHALYRIYTDLLYVNSISICPPSQCWRSCTFNCVWPCIQIHSRMRSDIHWPMENI